MRKGTERLAHGWRAGVLVTPGLALDHAAMMRAALALHEARNFGPAPAPHARLSRRRDGLGGGAREPTIAIRKAGFSP